MNIAGNAALTLVQPEGSRTLQVYDNEKIELLKRTICKGSTDDEFELFMAVVNRTGLDPFSKQIHSVRRWNKKDGRYEMVIQTGIDGYRLIAQRTKEVDGQEGPFWCGPDGEWKDVWLSNDPPFAAKVLIYRKGCSKPFVGVARYAAYVQKTSEGKPNHMWETMHDNQLAKCAEALGLRKGFPNELSNIYTDDEMDQADSGKEKELNRVPENPAPKTIDPPKTKPLSSLESLKIAAEKCNSTEAFTSLTNEWIAAFEKLPEERKTKNRPNHEKGLKLIDDLLHTFEKEAPYRTALENLRKRLVAAGGALDILRTIGDEWMEIKDKMPAAFHEKGKNAIMNESGVDPDTGEIVDASSLIIGKPVEQSESSGGFKQGDPVPRDFWGLKQPEKEKLIPEGCVPMRVSMQEGAYVPDKGGAWRFVAK